MPSWLALGFQDSSSPGMGELCYLYDHVQVIMLMVIVFIFYIMSYLFFNLKFYKFLSEGTFVETVWSIVPSFLLIILVMPSMGVLYMVEDSKSPSFTFKIIAHQWYWTYVVPFYNNLSFGYKGDTFVNFEFDSSLVTSESPRLLGCSSVFFMPVGCTSRLLITSTDVIHSFASPSMGLKVDAIPGRINQLFSNPMRVGLYYGQCSEICGSNHSFMPISVKICSILDFDNMSKSYLLESLGDSCLIFKG